MLIVTGANGTLGSLVVERLLERVPAQQIGISVREPDKAKQLASRGVRVRRGDFEDVASLEHAFESVTDILIISAAAVGEVAYKRHQAAIDAARRAGARRILYTAHMGASPTSKFPPMRAHAQSEALLQASGVPFVSLRNGFYAATVLRYLSEALTTGKLVVPVDGKVSWTTHHDLADAAATALVDADALQGISPPLTAGVAYDFADIARIASQRSGKPVEHVVVSDEEFEQTLRARQLPDFAIAMSLSMFRAARDGEFAATDPTLAKLLGREPQTVGEVIV